MCTFVCVIVVFCSNKLLSSNTYDKVVFLLFLSLWLLFLFGVYCFGRCNEDIVHDCCSIFFNRVA